MIKPKLYEIQLNKVQTRAWLTARQVLTAYPHASLKAFMKYAHVGQYHAILTPEHRTGELELTRIQ